MSAHPLPAPPLLTVIEGGRMGRPSHTRLAELEADLDEARMELVVSDAERIEYVTGVLAVARRGQVALAAGYAPRQLLHDLESRAIRELDRIAGGSETA